jgi:hypothetical protein
MSAIKREHWKSAVVVEFEKLYELSLLSIGDETGLGQLDNLPEMTRMDLLGRRISTAVCTANRSVAVRSSFE